MSSETPTRPMTYQECLQARELAVASCARELEKLFRAARLYIEKRRGEAA